MTDSKLDERIDARREIMGRGVYTVLGSVLRPVAHHPLLAFAVFAVIALAFVGRALMSGYSYKASASLLVSPPAYTEAGPASDLMPQALDVPSYARLLEDDAILQKVCEQVYAKDPELWQKKKDAGALVPEVLRKQIRVETNVIEKTPQEVRYSRAIHLSVSAHSPEKAYQLINAWIDEGVKAVRAFSVAPAEATAFFLVDELFSSAKKDLEKKEDALRDQQVAYNVPLLNRRRDDRQSELARLETELLRLKTQEADYAGQLEELQQRLAKQGQKVELKRSPSIDADVITDAISKGNGGALPVFGEEVLNPIHTSLGTKVGEVSSHLEGVRANIAVTEAQISQLDEEIHDLNELCRTQELVETKLARYARDSLEYYKTVAKRNEEAAAIKMYSELMKDNNKNAATTIMVANVPVLPSRPENFLMRWSGIPAGLIIAMVAAVAAANVAHDLERIRAASREA